jgi:3-hydroxyisobutyrate dehydrogenase-like beta-hydroxyacid dehydrogenase
VVASINAATAQALGLAEALGLDPRLASRGSRVAPPTRRTPSQGAIAVDRSWDDPSFALDSVREDVGLIVDAAEAAVPATC